MMDDPRDAEDAANALPLNLEAEQALLGQLMFDNDVHRQVHDVVTAEDFSEPFHQRLYAAIDGLVTAGKLAEPTTLQAAFTADPAFEQFGGVHQPAVDFEAGAGAAATQQQAVQLGRRNRMTAAAEQGGEGVVRGILNGHGQLGAKRRNV